MITMWANVRYRGTPVWAFTTFNSFIHTIMYTYYALTSVGIHPPGKKYITTMQITQFVVGVSVGISYFVIPECLTSWGQKFALGTTILYLMPLTYLFVDFARKTYIKRQSKKTA
jgi:hypothetical protein